MRLYKLLKDLPTVKAGAIFKEKIKIDGTRVLKACESGHRHSILVREIDNFDEWFEEIKEPTDNIHWKPKKGEKYWALGNTIVYSQTWGDDEFDRDRYESGKVYKTKEEGEKALERKLAEVRLRRTSNFEPDWSNNDQNKWTVYYNHNDKELLVEATAFLQYPSAIYFDTYDSIKKSIEENKQDWLIYFGIKEWE